MEIKGLDYFGGFHCRRRPVTGEHAQYVARVKRLLDPEAKMTQAQRSDEIRAATSFPGFAGIVADSLDRSLERAYQAVPSRMRPVLRPHTLNDFRSAKRFAFEIEKSELPVVPEGAEYPHGTREEKEYEYAAQVYGRQFGFSWREWINDDLGRLQRLPESLTESALSTEGFVHTRLFWGSSGPLTSFFNTSVGQGGVATLPLTIDNLETAIQEMSGGTDGYRFDGTPIANRPRYLVVPPGLQFKAMAILNSTTVQVVHADDAARERVGVNNVVGRAGLELIVNEFIPSIVSGNTGQTTWALFSDTVVPGEHGALRGEETPTIWVRNDASSTGGQSQPFAFANDSYQIRVRHAFGATALDPRGGWASTGQG